LGDRDGGTGRFVILAAPRTGSNWLCSLLNSHPEILCHHELFNPAGIFYALGYRDGALDLGSSADRDRDPLAFLDRVWNHSLDCPCVGFKMTRGQDDGVIHAVLQDPRVQKIILRRNNVLRTYVSELIAQQTGSWEVYDRADLPAQVERVHVDLDALRSRLGENETFYAQLEQVLRSSGQRAHAVLYERLCERDEHLRLLEFLGVASLGLELAAQSVRQNPAPLSQLIANYAELESELAGSTLRELLQLEEEYTHG
jgi:hypothetical protein